MRTAINRFNLKYMPFSQGEGTLQKYYDLKDIRDKFDLSKQEVFIIANKDKRFYLTKKPAFIFTNDFIDYLNKNYYKRKFEVWK